MDEHIMLSLITIVNNTEVYNKFRISLQAQINIKYELIPIMNLHNELDSPREAFNQAGENALGKYLMFIHPDIRFRSAEALHDIAERVNKINNAGVIGVAGAQPISKNKRKIISSIYQGSAQNRVGQWGGLEFEEVQTVDECLFIVNKEYFIHHKFEPKAGWHLYAVEYCLNTLLDGMKNYVVKADIWHLSPGNSLDPNYIVQLEKLIKKYKRDFEQIGTTVKAWPTRGPQAFIYRKYYYIKQRIKQLI